MRFLLIYSLVVLAVTSCSINWVEGEGNTVTHEEEHDIDKDCLF